MKKTINLGAYGWRQAHWLGSFYPQDLPADGEDDWRLAYYSNEFNTVLVPADYWRAEMKNECEDWLDSVNPEFRFYVECCHSMFEHISLASFSDALEVLKPQLSALVFVNEDQERYNARDAVTIDADTRDAGTIEKQISRLADALAVDLFSDGFNSVAQSAGFTFFEDELTDLRVARAFVDKYAARLDEEGAGEATIIVDHPKLQAENLTRFKSVLEIMGY